jgi:hypothetical protein
MLQIKVFDCLSILKILQDAKFYFDKSYLLCFFSITRAMAIAQAGKQSRNNFSLCETHEKAMKDELSVTLGKEIFCLDNYQK